MKIIYQCEDPGCLRKYNNPEDCQACEAQDPGEPVCEMGDIVTCSRSGFGWYDGFKDWVVNPDVVLKVDRENYQGCPRGDGNCFRSCCNYAFYYIITNVDQFGHRWRYHLRTLAMQRAYSRGHTFIETHCQVQLVKDPEVVSKLRELGGAYLGEIYGERGNLI
jgi:hypothetical protein